MSIRESLQPTEQAVSRYGAPRAQKGEGALQAARKSARWMGIFFLLSNLTFMLGAFLFIEPLLGEPDYLRLIAANRSQVVFGVLLELTNAVAYLGIAVLLFPILSRRFPSLALGYVGFRIIEFIMQILSDLSPLALITLSEDYVGASAPAASSFPALGTLLVAERFWAFQMVSVMLALGALLLYTMLLRSNLVPRFLSIWGLIGAITVLTTSMLEWFAIDVSTGIGVILGLPMLLNELFLGVWLIVKGFNRQAVLSLAAE